MKHNRYDYHRFEGSIGRPRAEPAKKKFPVTTVFKIMAILLVAAAVIGGLNATNDCQPTVRCTDN